MKTKEFFLCIISILLTLVALEGVLRLINYPKPPQYGWHEIVPSTSHSEPRGTKIRILLLGDSNATVGSPGKLLAEALNSKANQISNDDKVCGTLPILRENHPIGPETLFEVDTLGAGGWGQDQELLYVEPLVKNQKYDLILLWFTPENDLWNNAFPTDRGGVPPTFTANRVAKPTFVLDKNGQLKQVPKKDILYRLLYSNYKLYTLLLRAVNRVAELLGYTGFMADADQYWYENFISKYKAPGLEELQDANLNQSLIRREFTPDEFEKINPYSIRDSITYDKFHFVIAADPSSNAIKYMVDLTRALVVEIELTATRSGSDFATFWYDASKTLQPLYPMDGIYNINGIDVKIVSSAMLKRLNEIFTGINHASIVLKTPEWRQPENDPHLTMNANINLMQLIANCLKRAPDDLKQGARSLHHG